VTDAELVDGLMGDCDCCLHLAAAVGVSLVVAYPLETLRRTVRGADVVISSAAAHGKRVVFASTSEVYGKSSDGALHEDSDRVLGAAFKSRWSYAIGKSYGEAIAYGYHREHGADTTVVRLFNTVGPRQLGAYGMVVPRLVRQAVVGDDVTVYGDGSQRRCFVHVNDAVSAILAVSEHEDVSGGAFTSAIRGRSRSCGWLSASSNALAPAHGSRSSRTRKPMTTGSRSWASARPTSPRCRSRRKRRSRRGG
jgi:UDP-glucose 4-epimerase